MKTISELKKYYQTNLKQAQVVLAFVEKHEETLIELNLVPNFWCGRCDFDYLTRPDVLKVIKAFPGHWDKSPSFDNAGITYTLDTAVDGMTIRVYASEPPPSCKIEETVTYKVIPERVERVVKRKVVCPEKVQDEALPSVEAQNEPELP